MNVLIVEDEEMIRETLGAYLEAYGCQVSLAPCGEEGLLVLAAQQTDVAVVDVRLPGMSGSEFIVQAHAARPEMTFLIYTGSKNFSLPPELIKIGMSPEHIFEKPLFDLGVLVKAIFQHKKTDQADPVPRF